MVNKKALGAVVMFWVKGILLVGSVIGYMGLMSILPTWVGVSITVSGLVIFLSVLLYKDETQIRPPPRGRSIRR